MSLLRVPVLQSVHQWLLERGLTPYCLIDTDHEAVCVPEDYIEDSTILMNLSVDAVANFDISDHQITFNASFDGKEWEVVIPVECILAYYAFETGQGLYLNDQYSMMMLDEVGEIGQEEDEDVDHEMVERAEARRSAFKVIK